MTISSEHFARMKAHVREETDDLVRESIARYLEHCSRTDIGAISLDGLFDTRQMMAVCASWVRNRLDVKWAEEMRANAPVRHVTGTGFVHGSPGAVHDSGARRIDPEAPCPCTRGMLCTNACKPKASMSGAEFVDGMTAAAPNAFADLCIACEVNAISDDTHAGPHTCGLVPRTTSARKEGT